MTSQLTHSDCCRGVSGTGGKLISTLKNYPGFGPLIAEFVGGLPAEIARLKAFVQLWDLDALRRAAHQIRGSAGGYGFDPITEAAMLLEESILASHGREVVTYKLNCLIELILRVEGFDNEKLSTSRNSN